MAAAAQLLEQAQVRVDGDLPHPIAPAGSAALQGLAHSLNQLVQQRTQLRDDMAQQVAEASRHIDQERSRLAALMSELTQSVVVCNLDGRILLYNQQARAQFRALSAAPALAGGAELIGLGRSIYAVFERKLVAHALEKIEARLARAEPRPTAQFVTTTPAGQLLRAVMTPVRGSTADDARDARLRADARQHHAPVRGRLGARPAAAQLHRRQPRLAGQPAGGGGDAGRCRHGHRPCASASRR